MKRILHILLWVIVGYTSIAQISPGRGKTPAQNDSSVLRKEAAQLAGDGSPLSPLSIVGVRSYPSASSLRLAPVDENTTYQAVINGVLGTFRYAPGDVSTPDDGVMVLVSSTGKRFKRVVSERIYVSWFGAVGDNVTNDAAAIQAAFNFVKYRPGSRFEIVFDPVKYYIRTPITLPDSADNTRPWLYITGKGTTIRTDQAISIFQRTVDYTKDYASYVVDRAMYGFMPVISGISFVGNGTRGQKGIDFNAVFSGAIRDCKFDNLDTAIVSRYALKCTYDNITIFGGKVGIKFAVGLWPGVVGSNCQNNINLISNLRHECVNTTYASVILRGDMNRIENSVIEGGMPRYKVRIEYTFPELMHNNTLSNIWLECVGKPGVDIYTEHFGLLAVDGLLKQYADTLLDMSRMDFNHQNTTIFNNCSLNGLAAGTFNLAGNINQSGTIKFTGENISKGNIGDFVYNGLYWVKGVIPRNVEVDDYLAADAVRRITAKTDLSLATAGNLGNIALNAANTNVSNRLNVTGPALFTGGVRNGLNIFGGDMRLSTNSLGVGGNSTGLYFRTVTTDQPGIDFRNQVDESRFSINSSLTSNPDNDLFSIRSKTANQLIVAKGNGDVGIGTNTPGAKLDVNGAIKTPNIGGANGLALSAKSGAFPANFDGAVASFYAGDHASFPGNLYFDFGSYTRPIPATSSFYIRSMDKGVVTQKLKIDKNGAGTVNGLWSYNTNYNGSMTNLSIPNKKYVDSMVAGRGAGSSPGGADAVTLTGNQTITGQKTINSIVVGQLKGTGSVPAIAAGPGAGTRPAVSVSLGHNLAFRVLITPGVSPGAAGSTIATITLNGALEGATPLISDGARNAAAAGAQFYYETTSKTILIKAGTALRSGQPYVLDLTVIDY